MARIKRQKTPPPMSWSGIEGIVSGTRESAIRNGHIICSRIVADGIILFVPMEPE